MGYTKTMQESEKVVAIGSVGGSGTRLITKILMDYGFYFGNVLNIAFDNMLFTNLFTNPIWYAKSNDNEKIKRLKLFIKFTTHQDLSEEEIESIYEIAKDNPFTGGIPPYEKIYKPRQLKLWGWKEPNTQIYMPLLPRALKGIKYIQNHHEVDNVLLTGGDTLMLSTARLEYIIRQIRRIDHVKIIRIGTKIPAFNPYRILDDDKLIKMFKQYSEPSRRIYMMCHFDHKNNQNFFAFWDQ